MLGDMTVTTFSSETYSLYPNLKKSDNLATFHLSESNTTCKVHVGLSLFLVTHTMCKCLVLVFNMFFCVSFLILQKSR